MLMTWLQKNKVLPPATGQRVLRAALQGGMARLELLLLEKQNDQNSSVNVPMW